MKVSGEHFDLMAAAIKPLDTAERREAYRQGDFPRSELVNNLDKRYRWDLFWAAWDAGSFRTGGLHTIGHYADAHIDTALRKIVLPIA